jgi:ABC-2 type transport system permease protein
MMSVIAPQVAGLAGDAVEEHTASARWSRIARSEWLKFRSVRSNRIGIVAALAISIVFGLIFSSIADPDVGPGRGAADPLSLSFAGFNLSQLVIGVLGVLTASSEYTSGLIKTTFTAARRRLDVLSAKAVVFGGIAFVVMSVAAVASFFGGTAVYGGTEVVPAITDPGVLRAVVGMGCYTAGLGVIGVALGFLLRSSAGAISTLVASLTFVPLLVRLLPSDIADGFGAFLPSNAGSAFTTVNPGTDLLSPTAGALVFAAWVVALLGAAAWSVRRRDA